MTGFRRFNDSTSKRILDLLETGYMLYETQGVYSRENYSSQVRSER